VIYRILRPRLWILDRWVRTHRAAVLGLILVLGLGGQWVYSNLIRERLAWLESELALTAIASWLPMGLFLLLVFSLLGVGDVMHQLFQASDLELLMVAPIPSRTIFLVKLLQGSRTTLIPALGIGAVLLALGGARRANPLYYPLVLLLIVSAMALVTALVMALVILLARLLPRNKIRTWLPVAISLGSLGLIFLQQSALAWFVSQTPWIAFLTEALLDLRQLILVVAGMVALALSACLAAYSLFASSFYEGWNRFRQVPLRRRSAPVQAQPSPGIGRLIPWFPVPLRAVLIKEWLELRRDPRALLNLAQPLLVTAVAFIPALSGGGGSDSLRPLLFWIVLVFLVMYLGFLPVGTSLMAVAGEGPNIALLRSTPVSMSDVLKAKFWATWLPSVASWLLVVSAAALWLRFPLWQTALLAGLIVWGSAGASIATLAAGGLTIDFAAEELKRRPSTLVTYLNMGLNFLFVLLTASALVWIAVRQFPRSPIVLGVRALAGYGAVGWLFSGTLWGPSILGAAQVAFWSAAKALWDAAVRRLDRWEVS
jgi:hypothetical protein